MVSLDNWIYRWSKTFRNEDDTMVAMELAVQQSILLYLQRSSGV